ncbi:MAG: hypothetical protein ABI585_16195 [Betaproteobacteria bacterium]
MAFEIPQGANPLAIGQVVARNIVPVVGIVAFGWSAVNVLLLYFVDTLLAMGVMFAGLASWFSRDTVEKGVASRLNAEAGAIAVAVFICAFVAVPLGMPLIFVGAMSHWDGFDALWSDQSLMAGIAWQAAAAIWSYAALWRELHVRSPDELKLKRRFALVFLRWFVILAAIYFPLAFVFGRFLPFVLVALYAGTTIFVEIAPDRFLRLMPGGAEEADPLPGSPQPPNGQRGGATSWRRRNRR